MRRLAGVLVCVLLLSACTKVQAGTALEDPAAAGGRERMGSADAAVGGVRGLDYCSIMRPEAVGRELVAPVAATEFCSTLRQSDGGQIWLTIGPIESRPKVAHQARQVDRVPWPLRLGPNVEYDDGCTAQLVFRNLDVVDVTAAAAPDQSTPPNTSLLCAAAREVAVRAAQDIVAGKAAQATAPEWLLGAIDPCSLLSLAEAGPALHIVDQYEKLAATPNPAGRRCQWGSTGTLRWHHAEIALGTRFAPEGPHEMIGGRDSVIEEQPGGHYKCAFVLTYAARGEHLVETASLAVTSQNNAIDACASARRLAEVVWPRLPK